MREAFPYNIKIRKIITLLLMFVVCYTLLQIISIINSDSLAQNTLIVTSFLAVLPAALWIYYLNSSLGEKIEFDLIMICLVSIGIFSMIIAGFLNEVAISKSNLSIYSVGFFYILIGPIEEGAKLFSIQMGKMTRVELGSAIDYAILGGIVGLGFTLGENMFYLVENPSSLYSVGIMRIHASMLHMSLGTLMGYSLGRAILSKGLVNYFSNITLGFLLVILVHGTYNLLIMSSETVGVILSYIPIIALLTIVLLVNKEKRQKKDIS